jgi:hypothetical protein
MSAPGIPRGTAETPPSSAAAWLTEMVDRGIRRSLREGKTSRVIQRLIQQSMVSDLVVTMFNHSPWVSLHPDLQAANIIINKEWDIVG